MRRLLLTRPENDNLYWAMLLEQHGIATVSSPLLRIETLPAVLNPDGYSGVILTSKHAVIQASACCDLPAYVTGDTTASLAQEYGFSNIAAIAPSARELLPIIPINSAPKPLLYASGEVTRVDVVAELAKRGIAAKQEIVYRASAADTLSDEAKAGLEDGSIDGALLFSARTAEIFQMLTPKRDIRLFCFSQAIADSCSPLGQWREVLYPHTPSAGEFEALIRQHYRN